jgi:hypothetical protein
MPKSALRAEVPSKGHDIFGALYPDRRELVALQHLERGQDGLRVLIGDATVRVDAAHGPQP